MFAKIYLMLSASVVYLFLLILAAHYVGDFIVQNRWMGENKSSSNWVLSVHVLTYMATLFVLFGLPVIYFGLSPGNVIVYIVANGALHFLTDYVSSRISKSAYESKNMKLFWATIGGDQLAHQAAFVFTLPLLVK